MIEEQEEEETKEKEKDTPSDSNPPPAKKQPLPPPFIVGKGLPAIPPKLVAKIQRGEFVDMAELLRDNIEADRRRAATAGNVVATLLGSAKPRREVPDLMSWVQCFGMYTSVLGEAYLNLRRGLWAYQMFIVREARQSSGRGWQKYDSMFRQQQASASDLKWDSVNNALYAVTFAAPHSSPHKKSHAQGMSICKWCQEPDHQSQECALILSQNLTGQSEKIQRSTSEG